MQKVMEVVFFSLVMKFTEEFIDGDMVLISGEVVDTKMNPNAKIVYSNLSKM